jgi:hypothetical protein
MSRELMGSQKDVVQNFPIIPTRIVGNFVAVLNEIIPTILWENIEILHLSP